MTTWFIKKIINNENIFCSCSHNFYHVKILVLRIFFWAVWADGFSRKGQKIIKWMSGENFKEIQTVWLNYLCLSLIILLGVCQRTKCIPGIPERSWKNSRGNRPGWMAAHRRHWQMASCKQNSLKDTIDCYLTSWVNVFSDIESVS